MPRDIYLRTRFDVITFRFSPPKYLGPGIPLLEKVYWFLGVWFLGVWIIGFLFVGFLVSQGFLVCWFHSFLGSTFQSFEKQ